MAKFLAQRLVSLVLTMLLVSVVVFLVSEVAPGNVVRRMLGQFVTPEQELSMREQLGLNRPVWQRYVSWLVGSDWLFVRPKVGMPLRMIETTESGRTQWWAEEPDGTLIQWRMAGQDLIALRRQPDGTSVASPDNGRWSIDREDQMERLMNLRAELDAGRQLAAEDQAAIILQLDRLIEILQRGDALPMESLVAALREPEAALDALTSPQATPQQDALQAAARSILNHKAVAVVQVAEELAATGGNLDVELLRGVPGRLGPAATLIRPIRPELADQVQGAARSALAGDGPGALDALQPAADAVEPLLRPVIELALALQDDDYRLAAARLSNLIDPSPPPDPLREALLADVFKEMVSAARSSLPDFTDRLQEASAGLRAEDVAAARAALQAAGGVLAERGLVIAKNQAAARAHVARSFWGVDNANHGVLFLTHGDQEIWIRTVTGGSWYRQTSGPAQYIPLQRGLLRGDPGFSMRTREPVKVELVRRVRNSAVLAAIAFVVVMPLSLVLGLIAGLNEGKPADRVLSLFGLVTTSSPNFASAIVLILVFSVWLKILPGATVFTSSTAVFENPKMLVLPVATLTLIELGYVLRMTRASMVDVMRTAYIRTAFLKGLPYWRIVIRHALRNALMAPITVIMLHVNWLMGGLVVVESIFGYPGLGTFLLASALYKDVFAIEAGAMVMVTLAVATQLVADIIYTFLNPRVRYA